MDADQVMARTHISMISVGKDLQTAKYWGEA